MGSSYSDAIPTYFPAPCVPQIAEHLHHFLDSLIGSASGETSEYEVGEGWKVLEDKISFGRLLDYAYMALAADGAAKALTQTVHLECLLNKL